MSCNKCWHKEEKDLKYKPRSKDNLEGKKLCYYCDEPLPYNDSLENKLKLKSSSSSENNGGSTDYFKIDPLWEGCQDIIEARNLNYAQGNILKVAFYLNLGRHEGTNYERELNKLIWFAKRELERIKE